MWGKNEVQNWGIPAVSVPYALGDAGKKPERNS